MTTITEKIYKDALNLQPVERAELLDMLFHSFDTVENDVIEAAWKKEAEVRIDAINKGEIPLYTEDEVFARINKK